MKTADGGIDTSARQRQIEEAYYFFKSLPVINDARLENEAQRAPILQLLQQLQAQDEPVVVAYIVREQPATFDRVCEIDYCGELLTKHKVRVVGFEHARDARFDTTRLPAIRIDSDVPENRFAVLDLMDWESHLLRDHPLSDEAYELATRLHELREHFYGSAQTVIA